LETLSSLIPGRHTGSPMTGIVENERKHALWRVLPWPPL
jgi:hypothetical protein